MEEIVALCKRRGFIYPTSSIYGGLANAYDYGPLGVELLKNIKELWWKKFIHNRRDIVGIDSQIILHPKTWIASGHVGTFSDAVVEDKKTHKRYRADHLVEGWMEGKNEFKRVVVESMNITDLGKFITDNKIKSPDGNEITDPKAFDLLMESKLGSIEGDKNTVYLRGETAQGIFTNFKNVIDTTRVKLPFGIGQIGKSFRNEVTLGQYIFRTFEFEQGEIEYFFDPKVTDWKKMMNDWKDAMWNFVTQDLKIDEKNLRWRRHTDLERSHYSKDTYDLDFKFPFGWKELWGVAYRTDYDLKQQMEHSGVDLQFVDPHSHLKIMPHTIEPAVGINRLFLMTIADAFTVEDKRIFLKIAPELAPYKAAVFPLVSNKPEIIQTAEKIFVDLNCQMHTYWHDRGNIGKRYRYQDEIGTPYCITIDYETISDHTVTIRDRDSMKQVRIATKKIQDFLKSKKTV